MWTQYNPVTIVHADFDKTVAIIRESLAESTDALLVTTRGMVQRGAAGELCARLADIRFARLIVSPHPDLDWLDGEINTLLAENAGIRSVVAYGGGSVMDAAKAVALALANRIPSPLNAWLRQGVVRKEPPIPLICIPTTAGTGAEVTPFSTIWDRKLMRKHSLAGNDLFPKMAIECPGATESLPPKVTLFGALDALSHALETLWNRTATPISSLYARAALERLLGILPVPERPTPHQRETLQQAALFAGLAISQSHTSLSHAMSYPLSLHFGVPHGLACAVFLPAVLELIEAEKRWTVRPDDEQIARLRAFFSTWQAKEILYTYCTPEDVRRCVPEMMLNSRAATFPLAVDHALLTSLVSEGRV